MLVACAGPLSCFFAGGDDSEAVRLRAGVEAWREDLKAAVVDKVAAQLDWDEGRDASFSAELGDAGWTALRLFAFYAERAELEWPDTTPMLLELDQHFREAADRKFDKSLYGQLLACEMWLPGEFPVTVRAPRPDGASVEIGSVDVLFDQLQWLNQRTFQADADEVASWRALPAEAGGELIAAAKRGYAALHAACAFARENATPLVVG